MLELRRVFILGATVTGMGLMEEAGDILVLIWVVTQHPHFLHTYELCTFLCVLYTLIKLEK